MAGSRAVFAVPDDTMGEKVCPAIVAREGRDKTASVPVGACEKDGRLKHAS